jgi:hypothetical protein
MEYPKLFILFILTFIAVSLMFLFSPNYLFVFKIQIQKIRTQSNYLLNKISLFQFENIC